MRSICASAILSVLFVTGCNSSDSRTSESHTPQAETKAASSSPEASSRTSNGPADAEVQDIAMKFAEGKSAEARDALGKYDVNAKILGMLGPSVTPCGKQPPSGSFLHITTIFADVSGTDALLARGADLAARDNFGLTPLHSALLSDEVASPPMSESDEEMTDAQIEKFLTDLHSRQLNVVQSLVAKNADVQAKDLCGRTPLFYAATYGFTDAAKLLIEKGARIQESDGGGDTVLHVAARGAPVAFLQLLLEKGADVNALNARKRTPLHEASLSANTDAVKFLLEHGANATLRDAQNYSGLDLAWFTDEEHGNAVRPLFESKGITLTKSVESGEATPPELPAEDESLPWTCAKSKLDIEAAAPAEEVELDSKVAAQEALNDLVQDIQIPVPVPTPPSK